MHDRDVAILVEVVERAHDRIEPDAIVDPQHAAGLDSDCRPDAVIRIVRIGHDRVEAVVSAA